MNLVRLKITLAAAAICFAFSFSACQKSDSSESFDVLNFSDETSAAAELVQEANEKLNKIKVMYKKNEDKRDELIAAMSEQDAQKVKKITDDLVYLINDGMGLGEEAVEKIVKAQQMNISSDFKEYLGLKEDSLKKQLDAFESRRQAVRILRDSFGTNDAAQVEKAKLGVKENEEIFNKMMEESRAISKQANELAKESSRRTNQ